MPFWGCAGTGRALAIGPYMAPFPTISKNEMFSFMKIPTTNIFLDGKLAQNVYSIAPITIEMPNNVIGLLTGTIYMMGAVVALFATTVVACGGFVIRWLGITLQNLWNCIGIYLKMDQKKVLILSA